MLSWGNLLSGVYKQSRLMQKLFFLVSQLALENRVSHLLIGDTAFEIGRFKTVMPQSCMFPFYSHLMSETHASLFSVFSEKRKQELIQK